MVRIKRRHLFLAGGALVLLPRVVKAASVNMHQLLKAGTEHDATEILLTTGAPPALRVKGEIVPLKTAPLTPADVQELVYAVLNDEQKKTWEQKRALRMSFGVKGLMRFRMILNDSRGAIAATLKPIPSKAPPLDAALAGVKKWSAAKKGLFLVSGQRDSGRTWTMAMLLDAINVEQHLRLLTVEDPIEFLHPHKNCYVDQFELGSSFDTPERGAARALESHADVIAWDLPNNHPKQIVEMAKAGAMVVASLLAPSAEEAKAILGADAGLVTGLVHVACPFGKDGKRVLQAHIA